MTFCYFFPCLRCPVCLRDEMGSCPRKRRANRVAGTAPYFNNAYGEYYYLRPDHFIFRIADEISDDMATPANCALSQVIYGLAKAPGSAAATPRSSRARAGSASTRSRWRATWAPTTVSSSTPSRSGSSWRGTFGADHTLSSRSSTRRSGASRRSWSSRAASAPTSWRTSWAIPPVIPEGLRMLRGGGTYLEVGSIAPGNVFSYDATALVRGDVRLVATSNYSPWALGEALKFLRRNLTRFPFHRLISHVFPLEKISDAFREADWMRRSDRAPRSRARRSRCRV